MTATHTRTVPTAATARPGAQVHREIWPLYARALRTTLRIPSAVVPSLVMPLFFLVVNTAALGDITRMPGFGGTDYVAFLLPVALVLTVAAAGSSSGLALVMDIDSGYFDKLLLSPIRRTSVLVARLLVDGTRAAAQAVLVLAVGLLLGGRIAAGPLGALLIVALAFAFGLAYAGIGLIIALRTGSTEATQASFVLFFPVVFLAPTFVPMEFLAPWLQTVAALNPLTHVIEGLRSLTTQGWVWADVAGAAAASAVIGVLTIAGAFRALGGRVNQ